MRTVKKANKQSTKQHLLYGDVNFDFIVQVLSPAFGGMTAFVKETEPLLERGQGQVIRPDERMCNFFSLRCLIHVC